MKLAVGLLLLSALATVLACSDAPTGAADTSLGDGAPPKVNACSDTTSIRAAYVQDNVSPARLGMFQGKIRYMRTGTGSWARVDLSTGHPSWTAQANAPFVPGRERCLDEAWFRGSRLYALSGSTLYTRDESKGYWLAVQDLFGAKSTWRTSTNGPFHGLTSLADARIEAADMLDADRLLVVRKGRAYVFSYGTNHWQPVSNASDYLGWRSIPIGPYHPSSVPSAGSELQTLWLGKGGASAPGLHFLRGSQRFTALGGLWIPPVDLTTYPTWTGANAPFQGLGEPTPAHTFIVDSSVTTSGDGSAAHPWKTISEAASSPAVGPGDTVYIRGDVTAPRVYSERVVMGRSGAPGQPITFAAWPEEQVVVDGTGVDIPTDPGWGGLFDMSTRGGYTSHDLRIRGLEVRNSSRAGFFCWGCTNITLENDFTDGTESSGIGIWQTHGVSLRNNDVAGANKSQTQECISVAASSQNVEVVHNHVHDGGGGPLGGEGIDLKDGIVHGRVLANWVHDLPLRLGIYIDGASHDTSDIEVASNLVERCNGDSGIALRVERGGPLHDVTVHDNVVRDQPKGRGIVVAAGGEAAKSSYLIEHVKIEANYIQRNFGNGVEISSLQQCDDLNGQASTCVDPGMPMTMRISDVVIDNNVIVDTGSTGVIVWRESSPSKYGVATVDGVRIQNNTIVGSALSRTWGGGISVQEAVTGTIIRNDLVSGNRTWQIRDLSGVSTIDHNLIDGFRGYTGEVRGSAYIEGDPRFVNPSAGDFHLGGYSPAVDKGNALLAPATDLDGTLRPQGAAVDIGAYERK